MKKTLLNNLNVLGFMALPIVAIGYYQQKQSLIWASSCVMFLCFLIVWLLSPRKKHETPSIVPLATLKRISIALHHSQLPVFNEVIKPILEQHFIDLNSIKKGVKADNQPLTLMDEKCALWEQSFALLKSSKSLYQNRINENRDKAITLFVFIAILFQEKEAIEELSSALSSLPTQVYSSLKKEAYRLYDLVPFLGEKTLRVNHDFAGLFAEIPAFTKYNNAVVEKRGSAEDKKKSLTSQSTSTTSNTQDTSADCDSPELSKVSITCNKTPNAIESEANESPATDNGNRQESLQKEDGDEAAQKGCIQGKDLRNDVLEKFTLWLEKRLNSSNRQFSLSSQQLVVSNPESYGNQTVFLMPEVLAKYQSRSGVITENLKELLLKESTIDHETFVIRENEKKPVLPCHLTKSFNETASSSLINGEAL